MIKQLTMQYEQQMMQYKQIVNSYLDEEEQSKYGGYEG